MSTNQPVDRHRVRALRGATSVSGNDERAIVAATAELLRELTGGTTTVIVEHDLAFVRRIADIITVMHRGQAVAEGSPDEVAQNALVRDVYLGRKTL
jgi:ABC-type uncharacterized transport system ATPase subunit